MTRSMSVRRSLALTAAVALTAWGAVVAPASALEPGNGNGNGQTKHESKNDDTKDKGDTSDTSDKGEKSDKGDKNGDGKPGNGPKDKGDKSNNGGNGNGPKDKGDKGEKGPKGPKGGDPAGNNGTVKITPIGEDDGKPQNTPHVTCGFDIEWYGFDEGDDIVSTVSLVPHAPTSDVTMTLGGPSEVFVGGDPATGAGTETGFDGEATYYPTFTGEPHPQQGYHVKLTIHTPGSQGADTKHKVFWVQPCEETTGGTDTDDDTTGGTTDEECTEGDMSDECVAGEDDTDEECTDDMGGSTGGSTEECDEDTVVEGEQASTSDSGDDTEVMGATAQAPNAAANADQDVPSAVDAGEEGNPVVDFVTSPLPLLVIGLGVALGVFALVSRRRAQV